MPELPDVQVFKEYLDATSLHRKIREAEVQATERMLDGIAGSDLSSRLEGRELTSSRRHGKHLFAGVGDEGWLRLHFGMTGELVAWEDGGESPYLEHVALRLDFADGGHLGYRIPRKFGAIGWVDDVDAFVEERGLGPDPLSPDFDLRAFREALEGRRGMVKTTLMKQEVLAGLGNVYVDEILFRVGLHPEASLLDLEDETIEELYAAMNEVVESAVEARVDVDRMPDDFVLPHRRGDGNCPKCGRALSKIEVGGRPTYFCSRDQQRRH